MARNRSLTLRDEPDRAQLELFRSIPGNIAPRDAQDLMAWPFFSLAKSPRTVPIAFEMGQTWISVEAVHEHGMATIWDADILIWGSKPAGRGPRRRPADLPAHGDHALRDIDLYRTRDRPRQL